MPATPARTIALDRYIVDVLMPDLIGHDHRPAAFVVYLFLLTASLHAQRDTVMVSLQTIATKTGLSKSAVQAALRHLKRRGLVDPALTATTASPRAARSATVEALTETRAACPIDRQVSHGG